jgi:hypothetical protein
MLKSPMLDGKSTISSWQHTVFQGKKKNSTILMVRPDLITMFILDCSKKKNFLDPHLNRATVSHLEPIYI